MMMISQMNQAQLLHWINMVSFAVVDITLYLDTHPKDEEALKYFNHYIDLRRCAMRAYAEKYGPLTIDSAKISGPGLRSRCRGKGGTADVEL